ncbi:hypothetical protein CkaCkLH20_10743 [Colletotrichum karsti]|uniref:L-glutamate gamma-semialdehyde dehydrogenase n=1 Tax=Colletotrichum karsti TaxID=1095194 RepID=A0A9P6HWR9_9PEZI|nr:uncharacterized protein CkaCkLH20_10743 [Colletotrichum karsti]KAF9871809.1 hypothetical protein CkaCkLH20_10743 [Colletotrichum karsti]
MTGRLAGKIALVSGSNQGFGRGILEAFVKEGALVLGLDLQAIDGPVDGFPESQAYQIKANVAEEGSWKKALETSIHRFGRAPSVVVHNAGWSYPNKSSIDVTLEEFNRAFEVNVKSIFIASKMLIPEMKKNGPGSTIVISSENAIRPGALQTWYNATKAGVSSATKSMALEFARDQLRFNTICPTSGNTPLLNKFAGIADGPVPAEIIKAKCEAIPIGRLVEPSDVANVALFLAEPASSIISGVEILVDEPANADGFSYDPGTEERKLLKAALAETENTTFEIPSIMNGERLYTGRKSAQKSPWNHHGAPLAEYHEVDRETVKKIAIPGALAARHKWTSMPFSDRAAIYKRAARLVETKYRWKLMAATMLGQGKTCGQAEGDCIAEVIDTLNFHVYYCHQLYQQQPVKQSDSAYNSLDYRPLEGFVLAISPFNFTALGAHIAFTPAILGNVVLWKPSPMAVLSNYILYQAMEEAGLPKGVVQFLPTADPAVVVEPALASPHFSGLHYTGSSAVLKSLFAQIGTNTNIYKTFPRIVGESGGKNFHLVHNSCREDVDWIASAAVRSAFEFQGQKCSALSRLYVPKSMWEQGDLKAALLREAAKMTHGDDVKQLHHPLGPIVFEAAFVRFGDFLDDAQKHNHRLLFGGKRNGSKGLFIQPAILEANQDDKTATSDLLTRELFGPLFAVLTYDDALPSSLEDVCDLIDSTSEYGLAGSFFSRDREAIKIANERLRDSVGMFCINDKCTGAVIGAHPFGGARSSGTNDKANSMNVLLRFSSIRTVKDSFESMSSTISACHIPE